MIFNDDARQKIKDMEYLRKALFGPFRMPVEFDRNIVSHYPDNSLVDILSRGIPLDYEQVFEIYLWLDMLDPLFPGGDIEKILVGNALDDCLIHEALKTTRTAIDLVGSNVDGTLLVKKVVLAWEQHYPGFIKAVRDRLAASRGYCS